MNSPDDAPLRVAELLARLRRAQAVAQVGSWELDLSTGSMWASEEAFRIYGLPINATESLPLDQVQAIPLPEYRAILDASLKDLVSGRAAYDVEFELCRPRDGARRTIHSLAEVERAVDGTPRAVVGTLQDITERKAIEEALRASEERLRMLLEHAADAIFLISAASGCERVVRVNRRACELTGFSRDELVGLTVADRFSDDELAREPLRLDLVRRGEPVIRERTLTRKDGTTVPVEMHTARLPDGDYQSIVRDISDRRRLEEQLRLRQRMDSIGELASGIAHDFNNILVAILGYGEILTDEAPELSSSSRGAVQQIVVAARRAADLVRRLQSLTRPDRRVEGSFDLHQVVADAFHLLSETTDRRIRKEIGIAPGTWFVHGNGADLYHALVNLGLNAVQAIEARGHAGDHVVRVDACRHDAEPGNGLSLAPGAYVHLRFSDTGAGMTADVRQRAFDPLFSTKQKGVRKGQGLGLTMVYHTVVVQHRGAIDIDSVEGRGTVFHLYLPAGRDVAKSAAAPVPAAPAGSGTVLVVEDEEQVSTLARRVLERAGYRVLVAGDGLSALTMFDAHAEEIRVVLLDQTLPTMSGAEVMAHIQRTHPGMPIVISSGNLVALPPGTADTVRVLAKPYSPSGLTSAVSAALA
jgi:two-component system, cell cycle sensor histidine kinase and response regulator CckA